jgi:hypothetical protein
MLQLTIKNKIQRPIFERENHSTKTIFHTCNPNLNHVIPHHTIIQITRGLSHKNPSDKQNPSIPFSSPETLPKISGENNNPNLNLMQKTKTCDSFLKFINMYNHGY